MIMVVNNKSHNLLQRKNIAKRKQKITHHTKNKKHTMLLSSQCIRSIQITMAATHSSTRNGTGEGKTTHTTEMELLT